MSTEAERNLRAEVERLQAELRDCRNERAALRERVGDLEEELGLAPDAPSPRQDAERLRALLAEVEWLKDYDGVRFCPLCHAVHPDDAQKAGRVYCTFFERSGHAPDCRLALALAGRFTVDGRPPAEGAALLRELAEKVERGEIEGFMVERLGAELRITLRLPE